MVGIIVALLVVQGTAHSPLVYANESQGVLLTHVHSGITGGATQEAITLFNPGSDTVEVTDWCLVNKNDVEFVCLSDEQQASYMLPAGAHGVIVSSAYDVAYPQDIPPLFIYTPTSQSSGSLVGSSDTLVLRDKTGTEVDRFAWTKSWASGSVMKRVIMIENPFEYRNLKDGLDWRLGLLTDMPQDQLERHEQAEEPEEELPEECPDSCTPPLTLLITEVLPNAAGSDEGAEFIELHNPHNQDVLLDGYSLLVGESSRKTFAIPDGILVQAGEYRAIFNTEIDFTLVNTNGAVRLIDPAGAIIDTTAYEHPPEDEAWALLSDTWQYTTRPTPGAVNQVSPLEPLVLPAVSVSAPKPCGANQYRSPETGRCRNIAVAASQTPCQEGYVRNTETNRCRKIVAETGPAACKTGQERNPETGRCRNIKKLISVDQGVKSATTEQRPQQWYIIWVVIGLSAVLLGYATWEWRDDVKRLWHKGRAFMIRPK